MNTQYMKENITFSFNEPNYPFGRCLNLGPGLRALNTTVDLINLLILPQDIQNSSVRVFFKDPENGDYLIPVPLNMKGDSIKMSTKSNNHLKKIRTKIFLSEHVKGDPTFDCEEYAKENPYRKCMEMELISKFHNLIGCHPPLVSGRKAGMCNRTFNLPSPKEGGVSEEIYQLLSKTVNDYESTSCKRPCRKYIFETETLYETSWRRKENYLKIVFSRNVILTRTSFLISIHNLLTGVGGAISGGRTLMWVLLTILGFTKLAERWKLFIRNSTG